MIGIRFDHVTKTFPRTKGQRWLSGLFRPGNGQQARVKVLDGISFTMREGDSYAIIGKNGAGKSTILTLIAGLLKPDSGEIEVHGGVSPMLDLGAGFHPDLTGRENLMVNSALLGLTRREALEGMDEMIGFSELEEAIDQPLRTYSTGMILRLSFSVAVAVPRDILLVDEVLAVGDVSFQSKCIDRIQEMKKAGKIFICVSHAQDLGGLCQKAMWIENGVIRKIGRFEVVMDNYLSSLNAFDTQVLSEPETVRSASGR